LGSCSGGELSGWLVSFIFCLWSLESFRTLAWSYNTEADLLIIGKRNWIRPTGSLLSVWATRLNKLEINGRDIGTSGFRVSFRNQRI
jgi:hypothetical protein